MVMTNKEAKVPMMANKETKHAIRTRMLINRGFVKLMQEKNFEDITVSDICDYSLITRATFYKYYEDKNHLVLCVLTDSCEELFKEAGYGDETKTSKEIFEKVLTMFLDFLAENTQKLKKFFQVGLNEKLRAMLVKKMTSMVEECIKKDGENIKCYAPVEIVANFLVGGFVQILMYVFEHEKIFTSQEVLSWFDGIYDQFYMGNGKDKEEMYGDLLKRFSKN